MATALIGWLTALGQRGLLHRVVGVSEPGRCRSAACRRQVSPKHARSRRRRGSSGWPEASRCARPPGRLSTHIAGRPARRAVERVLHPLRLAAGLGHLALVRAIQHSSARRRGISGISRPPRSLRSASAPRGGRGSRWEVCGSSRSSSMRTGFRIGPAYFYFWSRSRRARASSLRATCAPLAYAPSGSVRRASLVQPPEVLPAGPVEGRHARARARGSTRPVTATIVKAAQRPRLVAGARCTRSPINLIPARSALRFCSTPRSEYHFRCSSLRFTMRAAAPFRNPRFQASSRHRWLWCVRRVCGFQGSTSPRTSLACSSSSVVASLCADRSASSSGSFAMLAMIACFELVKAMLCA